MADEQLITPELPVISLRRELLNGITVYTVGHGFEGRRSQLRRAICLDKKSGEEGVRSWTRRHES